MRARFGMALFAAVAAPPALLAQAAPVLSLGTPAAEFPEGFTNLGGVRELPGGRLLVIETCDRVVKRLDFAAQEAGPVGRTGAGPAEYRTPVRLLPLRADSVAVHDVGNQRYLVLDPAGTPVRTFSALPSTTQSAGGNMVSTTFSPLHGDGRGRFYGREPGMRATASGMVVNDSAAIEWWDPYGGSRDTVAFYRLARPGPVTPEPEPPFTTGIQWAVAPDGRVALVHPSDYHVEFIGPTGARTAGRPIRFDPVRLSEGHKAEWREAQKPACPMAASGTFTTPDGKTGTFMRMATPEPKVWPDVLPPIVSGGVQFATDGTLWVRRSVAAQAPHTYDVFDAAGRVVRTVVLPKRAKLLGFGQGVVYVARLDADDLQYVQRYALPTGR